MYKQSCILLLAVILSLCMTEQTFPRNVIPCRSLISCGVNCIRQDDCSYFVFNETASYYCYGSATDLQAEAASKNIIPVRSWIKLPVESQTLVNIVNFVFEIPSEIVKLQPCPSPKQIPDAFVNYQQNPSKFISMTCVLSSQIAFRPSIGCYNNGSWDIVNERCYHKMWTVQSNRIQLNFESERLKVGSAISFSGPLANRQDSQLYLTAENSDHVLHFTLSVFPERQQAMFTCIYQQNMKWQRNGEGIVNISASYLNVTITLLETEYEIQLFSGSKHGCRHVLPFQSVDVFVLQSQVSFDEVKIVF